MNGRWARLTVAGLLVAATLVGIVPGSAPPAAADHAGVHCMWGKAYEASMLYRINDTMPAYMHAPFHHAVKSLNHNMGGRVAVVETPPTGWTPQVYVMGVDNGPDGIAGWWGDIGCSQDPSGHWWFRPPGAIYVNTFYTDHFAGLRNDPRWPADPWMLVHIALHELDHSIGGWHQPLSTAAPIKSVCNVSYYNIAPFKLNGGSCAGFAGYNKPQDIGHLWSRYPAESPTKGVECPTTRSGGTFDLNAYCTTLRGSCNNNPHCAMYLEGW